MTTPTTPPVIRRRLLLHRIPRLATEKRVLTAMASLPRAADFAPESPTEEVYDLPFTD